MNRKGEKQEKAGRKRVIVKRSRVAVVVSKRKNKKEVGERGVLLVLYGRIDRKRRGDGSD